MKCVFLIFCRPCFRSPHFISVGYCKQHLLVRGCCQTCSRVFLWQPCYANLCLSCMFLITSFRPHTSVKYEQIEQMIQNKSDQIHPHSPCTPKRNTGSTRGPSIRGSVGPVTCARRNGAARRPRLRPSTAEAQIGDWKLCGFLLRLMMLLVYQQI